METPSSTRRMTRSQTQAALNKKNDYNPDRSARKRNVLIDVTNDSPIAGIALETPTSSIVKKRRRRAIRTPGSGEALLRGQVKTLLLKVEEETVVSKISIENRPVSCPTGLLAPANTPEDGNGLSSAVPFIEVGHYVSQVEKNEGSVEYEKSLITRSLLLDFSEKPEDSVDSVEVTTMLTYKEGLEESVRNERMSASDDDVSSTWSIQVNASEGEEEEVTEEEEMGGWEDEDYDEQSREEEGDEGCSIDELCDGIDNISTNGKKLVNFEGKHTRFVYDSDDEIVETKMACQD